MKKLRISIHPLYIVLGLVLTVMGRGFEFVAYTLTVVLHEFAHAQVGKRYGFIADDISLMPYGARLTGAFNGVKTDEEIKIALAGPIFNLLIGFVFTALFWLIPEIYFFAEAFAAANFSIAILNFAPVYPLDGGRVFLAALSAKKPRAAALRIAARTGELVGLLFAVLFAVSLYFEVNATLATIAIFMFCGAATSLDGDGYKRALDRTYKTDALKRGLTVKEIAVPAGMKLSAVNRMVAGNYYYRVVVVDGNMRQRAVLDETALGALFAENDSHTSIGKAMAIDI